MAHGAPDYSNVWKDVSVFRLDDMAELAARLWSPNVWDRRGDVFFMEDFEHGLEKWNILTGGGDEQAIVSIEKPLHGGYCASLLTQTGSGGLVAIDKGFPLTASSKIGFESHFKPVHYIGAYDSYIHWYTGTQDKTGYIRLSFNADELQYLDEDGNFQTLIDNLNPNPTVSYYHFIKWTVDFESNEYMWVRYNEQTVDMSGIPIRVLTDTTAPHFEAYMLLYDSGAGRGECRLDNIILTQNEL